MKRFEILTGLKVIALACIYYLHTWAPKSSLDLSWGVTFFFVCSGFCVAAKYLDRPDWQGFDVGVNYLKSKLAAFWPLHLACILVAVASLPPEQLHSWKTFWIGVTQFAFLHAWMPPERDAAFALNGATWFLSALLFCYLLAPMLLSVIRRARHRTLLFLLSCALCYGLFKIQNTYNLLTLNTYDTPPFKCLQFFCAMCAFPVYRRTQEVFDRMKGALRFTLSTLLESLGIGMIVYSAVDNACLHELPFLYAICLLLLVAGEGAFSYILSAKPFRLLGAISLEFFILHQALIRVGKTYVRHVYENLTETPNVLHDQILFNVIVLATILVASMLYHRFLAKPLTRAMTRMLDSVLHWI